MFGKTTGIHSVLRHELPLRRRARGVFALPSGADLMLVEDRGICAKIVGLPCGVAGHAAGDKGRPLAGSDGVNKGAVVEANDGVALAQDYPFQATISARTLVFCLSECRRS